MARPDPVASTDDHAAAAVLDAAPDPFLWLDDHAAVTGFNRAAARTLGLAAEAVGRPLHELIDGLDPVTLRAAPPTDRRLVAEADRPDGTRLPLELHLAVTGGESPRLRGVFLRDVSAHRRTEVALGQMTALVDGSPNAIAITDGKGRITTWNPAAERLFGWPAAEMLGETVDRLIPSADRVATRALWARLAAGESLVGVEADRLHRDGTRMPVEMTLRPMGTVAGSEATLAIYRDIRERRRAETELAAQTSRLRALSARDRRTRFATLKPPASPDEDRRLVDLVLGLAREHLGLELAWLTELDGGEQRFDAVAADPGHAAPVEGSSVPRRDTLCDRLLAGTIPEAIDDLRRDPRLRALPIVATHGVAAWVGVPVYRRDGRAFGTLCVASRRPGEGLGEREADFLRVLAGVLAGQREHREDDVRDRRGESELTAVSALLATLDARDHYTGAHSDAVVALARQVASRLGLSPAEVDAVTQVAELHDLGKVGVPDAVLQKPGPLNEAEWAVMREHPAIGARIVATIRPLAHLAVAVHAEHERWDGRGYPDGLAGEAIPLASRITLACDAYHAMISDRPYRTAIGHEAALAELHDHAGTQFDPQVVDALTGVLTDAAGERELASGRAA